MSLLEDARAHEMRPGGLCGVRRLINEHGPELNGEIEEAVAAGIQWSALSKALGQRIGQPFAAETLSRHYGKKECKCWGVDGNPV